ncbi:hypothetical protein [Ideonella sp. YS5]|uniref:hypothetical protein n=1 Tax=Ideonella sp. YS5 TaxID=3453714 RepID=UPI003EEDB1D1
MRDRLSYACIGLVLGLLVATLLWWLHGSGLHVRVRPVGTWRSELLPWLKFGGGGGAVAGFILKERIGDLMGGAIQGAYDVETSGRRECDVPRWLVFIVLACAVLSVWYFVKR